MERRPRRAAPKATADGTALLFFAPDADARKSSCASPETVMRIIGGNHAHHLSKSCASSRQIMRINGNNDADDLIIHLIY